MAETPLADDEAAVMQIVTNWDKGWETLDAGLACQDYSEDADWINAFGRKRKGRGQIQEFLARGFKSFGMASLRGTSSSVSLRFVRPDVAVVLAYRETMGQKSSSGQEYPKRKTHSLRVLVKEQGKWAIMSHLIMDEKEPLP